ncbi:hypothetical protein BK126_04380 [Paenibacillus sp. FSL H7-0326]|uniref:hypothetical protein n=1 Tax=Paenibacillus sp. FSL H7-0326 TaxID=1921144 RepID=UPI00096FA2AD|nr:hypothetical protein [Paenibacillus sp. FSL H7-0326]OMC71339.1 hypothetical protein BK126_04380 [Paenibacillus sp. FSL H7-0326]
MLETYNEGNHNEQFGTHLQYEDFYIRTTRNQEVKSPNEWTLLIDRTLYFDTYLAEHPKNTLRGPVVKKFITNFLLHSANSDSGFLSAFVTLRANIYSGNNLFALDIVPLVTGNNGGYGYNDLLRLYVTDNGDHSYNLKLYLRYPLPLSTYRIKVLYTALNDNQYYFSYIDNWATEEGIFQNPNTQYRLNSWLYNRKGSAENNDNDDPSRQLISESQLPTLTGLTTVYPSRATTDILKFASLPNPSEQFEGKTVLLTNSSESIPYICLKREGGYQWRRIVDSVVSQLNISGNSGTARGIYLQTDGINRFGIIFGLITSKVIFLIWKYRFYSTPTKLLEWRKSHTFK